MTLQERIDSFISLGETLRKLLKDPENRDSVVLNDLINKQHLKNPWFTPENVNQAVEAIAEELTMENLIKWTSAYPALQITSSPLKVGVIMAGNIPVVGFHDFISVLISGNKIIAKASSKDDELILFISTLLCSINPGFTDMIDFREGTISGFDAVIATGSDNSSRYFEYYFGRYPNIIRRNRNSIAIIDGKETESELRDLGNDIFSYFGLGCRNVSKIYIPEGYELSLMTKNWEHYSGIISNIKYANNYDFNKAVFIVNREKFTDTGYLLLREESKIQSPVSVLHYEHYSTKQALEQETDLQKEKIQCIISRDYTPFGKAQSPHLWDYADGVDTLEFLLKKNITGIL